jgi:hypothetical protein
MTPDNIKLMFTTLRQDILEVALTHLVDRVAQSV